MKARLTQQGENMTKQEDKKEAAAQAKQDKADALAATEEDKIPTSDNPENQENPDEGKPKGAGTGPGGSAP